MFKKNPIDDKIAAETSRLLSAIKTTDPAHEDYPRLIDQLTKLYELNTKSRVSKDQLLTVAANIAGIFLVIKAEHVGIITTKAFSLVKKIL